MSIKDRAKCPNKQMPGLLEHLLIRVFDGQGSPGKHSEDLAAGRKDRANEKIML